MRSINRIIFSDYFFHIISNMQIAQAYKQAGNSVTVTVIEAIGRRILAVDEEPRKMGDAA